MLISERLRQEHTAYLEETPWPAPATKMQPDARILRTTDVAALSTLFGDAAECIQLTAGRFHATAVTVQLRHLRMTRLTASTGVQLRIEPPAPRLLLGYLSDGNPQPIANGQAWFQTDVLLVPGGGLSLTIPNSGSTVWIEIDREHLARIVPPLLAVAGQDRAVTLPLSLPPYRKLDRAISDVFELAAERHAREFAPDTTILERTLSAALTAPLRTSQPRVQRKTSLRRTELVYRVEQYMWEHIEEAPSLRMICAATGARMRSLIYAFESVVGMSPMQYLKIRRLNAARRKLQHPSANQWRIADIAADCGFWHMGHFGSDYKQLFDITPSQTSDLPATTVDYLELTSNAR
ncbi:MAG: helix-turn-helix transcriptional regulator [Candidatus Eremiobacteraeota bacterium]|nr:helix-turn-helix transcriptional regulator [Candidatus Eremiobacteraeota bacterium]